MPSMTISPLCPPFQISVHPFRISSIISSVEARRSSHVLILIRFRRIERPKFRRQCWGVLHVVMLALLTATARVVRHTSLSNSTGCEHATGRMMNVNIVDPGGVIPPGNG